MIFLSLFIDLSTIINNIKNIQNNTNKEIMIVLKNNAYGIGSKKIIKILKECNVKWIVYNTYDEYQKDKEYLGGFKILILSSVLINQIECDENLYYSINNYKDVMNVLNVKKKINVHIQVDTGMNRVGIRSIDVYKKILNDLIKNENINIDGIYTHFGSNYDEYEYYNKQINKFIEYVKLYNFKNIHSAATSSLHKNIYGNLVRVGLAIYGYGNPYIGLHPSIKYTTKLINQFILLPNETLGYNQGYIANKNTLVGVVPIGYNDITNIDYLYYNNIKLQIIGNRCMNHTFIKLPYKINNLSSLLVLPKSDIIYKEEYNWYYILTSIKNIKKIYIRRFNYDIPTIFKRTNKKNRKYVIRGRSN